MGHGTGIEANEWFLFQVSCTVWGEGGAGVSRGWVGESRAGREGLVGGEVDGSLVLIALLNT